MSEENKKEKRLDEIVDRFFRGFTLVELLAVIVILAIIMLIAIPAILESLESAKRKAFIEYSGKAYLATQNEYLEDQLLGNPVESCVMYNITSDLGLNNTGDYKGYILIVNDGSSIKYYMTLYDNNYIIGPKEYNDINFNVITINSYKNEKDDDIRKKLAAYAECSEFKNKGSGTVETNIPDDAISKKLKVEDYVHYYPSSTSYKIDSSLTGCAETDDCGDVTINPSNSTLWKVLSINDDGTVNIGGRTNDYIYFYGFTGFKNSTYVLKQVARQFGDNKFAKELKTIGEDYSEDYVSDEIINKIKTSCSSQYFCNDFFSKNPEYIKDDSLQEFLNLSINNQYFLNHTFVAGRSQHHTEWVGYGVYINYINSVKLYPPSTTYSSQGISYDDGSYPIYGKLYGKKDSTGSAKLFDKGPIETYLRGYASVVVRLKANARILSGTGTQNDPYELTF